jgi:flagellar biosynthesis protein FlhF
MRIKKYEAADMKEALKLIKEELGPNAVILSTKKITKPAGRGLLPKSMLEVTAAVDYDSTNVSDKDSPPKSKKGESHSMPAIEPDEEHGNVGSDIKEYDDYLSSLIAELSAESPDLDGTSPLEGSVSYTASINETDITQSVVDAFEKYGMISLSQDISQIKADIMEIRRTLETPANISVDLAQDLKDYYALMIKNGLDELVAYRFLKGFEKSNPSFLGKAQLRKQLTDQLAEQIPCESDFVSALSKKVVNFIGPTGVGKTTTIAKLAAILVLKYTGKVCLVTSDNFRIGAVDQLKTYADIVRLPFYVATSGEDLAELLKGLSDDYDYILLDSTGRSPYDSTGVKDAAELVRTVYNSVPTMISVLVLSLASNHRELQEMYERFSMFEPEYIIFTKLDETRYFGPLATLAIRKKIPLLLFSTGQGVPDDMEVPDGKKIAKKLLQEIPTLWHEG